jgi:hypothetical protein
MRAESERLAREAEASWREAKETRGEALAARRRAKRLRRAALETPVELLPHSWLWVERNHHREFDWDVFDRPEVRRERKLERDLGDLHIRALFAWATYVTPRDDAERERYTALLKCLLERFLPDDFGVLTACRDMCESGENPYDARLASLIDYWAAADPAWWALRFAVSWEATVFSPLAAARLLRRAAESRGLPTSLCIWLGDELRNSAEKLRAGPKDVSDEWAAAALAAYERAATSTDPTVLFALGLTLCDHGLLERSLEVLEDSRRLADSGSRETDLPPPPSADEYRRTIAIVLSKLGRTDEASDELARIDADELSPEIWRAQLVKEILADRIVDSVESYRPLKNWLGRVVTRAQASGNAAVLRDAADGLLELTLRRYQTVVRRPHDREFAGEAAEMTPTIVPVGLALDADLFPQADATDELTGLFDPHTGPFTTMQERIKEATGVTVPLPTISPVVGAATGRFTVFVNGASVATGTAGTPETPLWARYMSMVGQLEGVLLRNLDAFLGVQDVAFLLDEWESRSPADAEQRRELRVRTVPDETSLARLAEVLRGLVREGVPVTDVTSILEALSTAPAAFDRLQRIEYARAALADSLPGADGSRRLVRVPRDVEKTVAAWTHRRRGKRFLALPGDEAGTARAALRGDLDGVDGTACLVVSDPALRPFVQKLLASEHPGVPVLSMSELPDTVLGAADWSAGL